VRFRRTRSAPAPSSSLAPTRRRGEADGPGCRARPRSACRSVTRGWCRCARRFYPEASATGRSCSLPWPPLMLRRRAYRDVARSRTRTTRSTTKWPRAKRRTVIGCSTRSPFESKATSPRIPFRTCVRRSSSVTDARLPSERAIAAAHRLEAERLVEHVQVVGHRVAAVGVDDRDRHAPSVVSLLVQRPEVVRRPDRPRAEAGHPYGAAALSPRRAAPAGLAQRGTWLSAARERPRARLCVQENGTRRRSARQSPSRPSGFRRSRADDLGGCAPTDAHVQPFPRAERHAPGRNRTSARGLGNRCSIH
jgi:hypothetical protein